MERGELGAAVARAIADNRWRVVDASDGHPSLVEDPDRAAAAAIGVVLAEAQRSVKALPIYPKLGGVEWQKVVLAALEPPPPV